MLFTLAAVVFFAAIMTFFSQEFIRTFKKIFAIRGAKLILPLVLASWFIFTYDYLILWVVYYYREVLHGVVRVITEILPLGSASSYVALVIVLTFISVVPVIILDWLTRRQNYKPYAYPYVTSTLIWLVSALTLIVL